VTATSIEKVNGHAAAEPGFDAVALAKADAIRTRAAAEADAARIEAEGKAEAEKLLAAEKAEKERIANERAAMRLEKERADHAAYLAKKAAEKAKADADREKAEQAAAEEAEREAQQLAEQERSENLWKWGARGIYLVGLIIAAPVQFLAFWDEKRPFMIAAPALLEGLALVLACGAAWAVAHRRDVLPYRIGIMAGALIAAGINLWHGLTDPAIGLNAGLIGAIASLGGPIVLMAYEHGIAQKVDGIPSYRERRAAKQTKLEADRARDKARREKQAAEAKAAAEKAAAEARAAEEQKRKDADRQQHHPEVWAVADALRSARGSAFVTEQIWAEAWLLVTGCKTVGITLDIEARGRAQQARVKAATDVPIIGDFSLVDSQKGPRPKKDPNTPDGRRNNGGTPPVRRPGDTAPYSPVAKKQAALEQTTDRAPKDTP
jgi:chemotaxis protein histidine kinase CheA